MPTTTTTERLRIALVSTEYPPAYGGGIGTCMGVLARGLAGRGHDVTVVTPGTGEEDAALGPGRLRVVGIGHTPRAAGGEPARTLEAWWSWSEAAAAAVGRMAPDVVEFPDYRAEAAALLAHRSGVAAPAIIVRLHTPLVVLAKYNAARARHRVLEAMEVEAILGADGVISSSDALTREVRGLVPELGEVEFARYGVDPALPGVPPAGPGGGEIVCVGRLEERKGVAVLARAAAEFLAGHREATLHIVGGDTAWSVSEPSARGVVESLIPAGLRERVRFHGALPPAGVRERMLGAAVCVFPSLFEAGPYACLEAMALGRPVIGTDAGGMAEMIQDGVSGRLCRAGDAPDLARVVGEALDMPPAERARMGAAARERVGERYSAQAAAEETEEAYRRIMARARGGPPAPSGLVAVLHARGEREAAMATEGRAAGAERDRLAAGWGEQVRRIAELDAQVARIWVELRGVAAERDSWHGEAQRLARAWEALSSELREASLEAGRLKENLLATQGERAALLDRVSRLERAVAEAEGRPVFKILARAGLVRQVSPAVPPARGGGAPS